MTTTVDTTDREHAAMEAAGMDDAELAATIRDLQRDYSQHTLVTACWDEREARRRARFLNRVHETKQD